MLEEQAGAWDRGEPLDDWVQDLVSNGLSEGASRCGASFTPALQQAQTCRNLYRALTGHFNYILTWGTALLESLPLADQQRVLRCFCAQLGTC